MKLSCEVRGRLVSGGLSQMAAGADLIPRYMKRAQRENIYSPHFYTIAPLGACSKTLSLLHHHSRKQKTYGGRRDDESCGCDCRRRSDRAYVSWRVGVGGR